MNASISVVCYKSKTLSNGESPLMLQITKDKKRKYQSLGISVNPKHWNFLKGEPKPKCPNRDYILKIILAKKEELQRKVLEFNSRQREYSVYSLLKETERTQHMTVGEFYLALIDEFERNGKLGNRRAYKGSYNSLNSFTGDNLDICFEDITQGWLLNYESWLRAKGNKETTISIQFRTLRSVYNKAIKRKCVEKAGKSGLHCAWYYAPEGCFAEQVAAVRMGILPECRLWRTLLRRKTVKQRGICLLWIP